VAIETLAAATAVATGGWARTLDEVMAATLAVAGPDGSPSATAFLLAEPRVIVCDAFAAGPAVRAGQLTLIGADGRRLTARRLNVAPEHAFGPLLFEAPATLRIPGIRLSSDPLGTTTAVQVFVAAGERVGIGAGTVTDPRLPPQEIQPLPQKVRDLVALACYVAPGSSGAPVVDADLAVRGLVVASNANPADPVCFAYPAAAWTKVLQGIGPN
jgi:S1-C subfamily serine protease